MEKAYISDPGADSVRVEGARVNNLKNIDVAFPHGSLSVVTGLSGCGKSSLAFDTVFAEGQRRYIETFSAYARNMMGAPERPDVDKITGLSPVISIEQKTVNRNPRSTVGTTTEIYDFFRLLYARLATAVSYVSGEPMVKYSIEKIVELAANQFNGKKIHILAPVVKNRKGHYKELFENLRKKGFLYVRVDGELRELTYGMKLDRYKNHSIELVIDRLRADSGDSSRMRQSIEQAMKMGDKQMMILDAETGDVRYYSLMLMDPVSGIAYPEPAPHDFSFNSPQGACPCCKGLGIVNQVDVKKLFPDPEKSIRDGGISLLGKYKDSLIFRQIEAICKIHGASLTTPVGKLPEEAVDMIINGTTSPIKVEPGVAGLSVPSMRFDGLARYIELQQTDETPAEAGKIGEKYFSKVVCPECHGARLNNISLHYFIAGKNIADVSAIDIVSLYQWTEGLEDKIDKQKRSVAIEILKEIRSRLKFLLDVGLGYLSLNRSSASLSGGESQRIRLATQIGSKLVNVLYILDEPSIGLHPRDNTRLISSLKTLRDAGNSIIVVEHDREIMEESDWIVDVGPGAGEAGGQVMFQGRPADMKGADSVTARYLDGRDEIPIPSSRRSGNGKFVTIKGASGHNLKNIDIDIPLGLFICVTGVSGSGKSSLISGTLKPAISAKLYRSQQIPLPFEKIEGMENIDKIVTVDQSPIGRSPRSNPATFTGLFSEIRKLFTALPEAKIRGYKPGRFSFNVTGGRCEHCKGNGYLNIEMNFLPDVLVPCPVCHSRRYNRETLEVRYKGKSIADVLDMPISTAFEFFKAIPSIARKLETLVSLGLGYLKLGQPSSTLSGGENQRLKLAAELQRKDTGKTLFLLDEPTTGLHFSDVKVLLGVIGKLTEKGNTVVVVEHNTDMMKSADYIIDLGPEGGAEGGKIMGTGTPEQIAQLDTFTGEALRKVISSGK